jgi:hypothetical protein
MQHGIGAVEVKRYRYPKRSVPSENRDPVTLERFANPWTKTDNPPKVDRTVQRVLQQKPSLFHADQGEGVAFLDLHGNVDVAVGAVLTTRDRPKHRQMPHPATPKLGFLRRELTPYYVEGAGRHDRSPEGLSAEAR